jgi:hypothetical protein
LDSRGRWTKPPYQARHPNRLARVNDPATWATYDEAVAAYAARHGVGIGLMLKDGEIGAIDLDRIRDLLSGVVLCRWAEQLIADALQVGAYVVWTVSGTGARIVGIAHGAEIHRKHIIDARAGAAVEIYRNCARYITISGLQVTNFAPHVLPDDIELTQLKVCDELFENYQPPAQATRLIDFNSAEPQDLADWEDLIQHGASEGERSEKFQSVVWHLAKQGWGSEQIAAKLAKYPNGIGSKYSGRLQREVDRSFAKWLGKQQAGASGITANTAPRTPWPQLGNCRALSMRQRMPCCCLTVRSINAAD